VDLCGGGSRRRGCDSRIDDSGPVPPVFRRSRGSTRGRKGGKDGCTFSLAAPLPSSMVPMFIALFSPLLKDRMTASCSSARVDQVSCHGITDVLAAWLPTRARNPRAVPPTLLKPPPGRPSGKPGFTYPPNTHSSGTWAPVPGYMENRPSGDEQGLPWNARGETRIIRGYGGKPRLRKSEHRNPKQDRQRQCSRTETLWRPPAPL